MALWNRLVCRDGSEHGGTIFSVDTFGQNIGAPDEADTGYGWKSTSPSGTAHKCLADHHLALGGVPWGTQRRRTRSTQAPIPTDCMWMAGGRGWAAQRTSGRAANTSSPLLARGHPVEEEGKAKQLFPPLLTGSPGRRFPLWVQN